MLLHRRKLASTLMAAGLVAGLASGQKTWIVDKSNGPGTHYTDLPPAVAPAAHGDTIIVRKGTYKTSWGGTKLGNFRYSNAVVAVLD
ncbi:MAG: hypothetical protein ACE5F1_13050 [Planctomycetota bacterium]